MQETALFGHGMENEDMFSSMWMFSARTTNPVPTGVSACIHFRRWLKNYSSHTFIPSVYSPSTSLPVTSLCSLWLCYNSHLLLFSGEHVISNPLIVFSWSLTVTQEVSSKTSNSIQYQPSKNFVCPYHRRAAPSFSGRSFPLENTVCTVLQCPAGMWLLLQVVGQVSQLVSCQCIFSSVLASWPPMYGPNCDSSCQLPSSPHIRDGMKLSSGFHSGPGFAVAEVAWYFCALLIS